MLLLLPLTRLQAPAARQEQSSSALVRVKQDSRLQVGRAHHSPLGRGRLRCRP
jgi:hypothetical protein